MRSLEVWPLFVRCQEDELLTSWMVRLAHNHKQKIFTFYQYMLGPKYANIWSQDIDNTTRKELLECMANHTNTPLEDVEKCTFKEYNGKLYIRESIKGSSHFKWILPISRHYSRNSYPLLFCPVCLQKDGTKPYFRKKWRLSLSIVCPLCHVWLKEKCDKCGCPIYFIKNEMGKRHASPTNEITCCYNCSFDIRDSSILSADIGLINQQALLYDYINKGHTPELNYSHLYFDALHEVTRLINSSSILAKDLQIKIANKIGIEFSPTKYYKSQNFEFLPLSIRANILIMSFELLKNWPENFLDYCYSTYTSSSAVFGNKKQEAFPYWYWRTIRETIYQRKGPYLKSIS